MTNKLIGNLLDYAETGKLNVIVHGCNCFHTMGAGIAKEIKKRFPNAYEADTNHTQKGDKSKLGFYTWSIYETINAKEFFIINAYTQYNYGKGKHIDYAAIKNVFKLIACNFPTSIIGYPKIGAGLAGGDWSIIEKIINEELKGLQHYLVVLK